MNQPAAKILAAKAARRQQLAEEQFPAKIAMLLQLQALAAPILRQRGRDVRPWQPTSPAAETRPAADAPPRP